MKQTTLIMTITLILLATGLKAQSLDSLLNIAALNNIVLQALEKEYEAALLKGPQVSTLPKPEVNAGVFILPPETRLGPQWFRVGASQMFPWKGTLKAKEEVMLTMAKVQYEKVEALKLDLFYNVKKAYYSLYELRKTKEIISKNLRLLDALENTALAKMETAKGNMIDVLKVQAKKEELNNKLSVLENKNRQPLAALNYLLNRPLDTPVTITENLTLANIPYQREELKQLITEQHPLIKQLDIQQEVSEKNIALNRLEGKPFFGLGLDYIMVTKRTDADPKGNGRDIVMPKASMSLSLYRKKYNAKEKEERLKIEALDLKKQDIVSSFLEDIEWHFIDHEDARLKYQLNQKLKDLTQKSIDLLQTYYSVTAGRFDELITMQMDLVKYDVEMLKTILQSHEAKIGIERFLIEPINQ